MSIQMELHKIIISDTQDQQIIMLKEVDGERKFPMVIGTESAVAIDRRLKGIQAPRPLTHDLLASVIEQLGGTIDRIEINNLQDHTFFAKIVIRQNGDTIDIDSRPSDAIARASVSSTSRASVSARGVSTERRFALRASLRTSAWAVIAKVYRPRVRSPRAGLGA